MMTPEENQVYREIGRTKPKLAQQFEACLIYATGGWKKDERDSSGEAFSNAVRSEPCCNSLETHLANDSLLLARARACIKGRYRP